MFDELTLFKLINGSINSTLVQKITSFNPIRSMRRIIPFYLPFVTLNIEYYSLIVRIQREHNEFFDPIPLTNISLSTFRIRVLNNLYEQ